MPTAPKVNANSTKAKVNRIKTTASAKKALVKGGRRAGAQNFSIEDKEYLISLLEAIHPLGPEQWENIVSRYNSEYAKPKERSIRDKESLRQQWYKMTKVSKPTGDPSCPEYIRRAKRLNREIQNEIAMTGIDDDGLTDSEREEDDVEADEVEADDLEVDDLEADDLEDNDSVDENEDTGKENNHSQDKDAEEDENKSGKEEEKSDDNEESAVLIRDDSDDEKKTASTKKAKHSKGRYLLPEKARSV
jgi:cobalamin biosynthesis protein CobT